METSPAMTKCWSRASETRARDTRFSGSRWLRLSHRKRRTQQKCDVAVLVGWNMHMRLVTREIALSPFAMHGVGSRCMGRCTRALALFAAAYRFGSHGIRLKDNRCIGLACAALAIGALLLGFAFWNRRRQRA